jgi:isopentenyl-diphosphate Delta-isomerase
METVDILTSDGSPIGRTVLRSEAHRDGLWHRTVHVWIQNRKGEILLQKRSFAKETFPGLWDISAAGHITAGDSSGESAVREISEELGVKVAQQALRFLFTMKGSYISPDNAIKDNEITDVYLCTAPIEEGEIIPDPKEVSGVTYHSIARLKELLVTQKELFVPHDEEYERLFHVIETDFRD